MMSPPSGTFEVSEAERLILYQGMLRARMLEKRAYDLFMEGLVQGTTHLGLGQEAVAAGFAAALRPDDMSFATYRGHNHMLLRGTSMASILGECARMRTEIVPEDELRKANLILREKSAGSYMVLRDGLAKKGFDISDLHKILTLGNSEAIAFAVQEGVGVGFVSMLVAQRIVKDQVAIVRIDDLELSQDIFIGQHRRLPSTSAQVAFWKMAIEPQSEALLKIKSYLSQDSSTIISSE